MTTYRLTPLLWAIGLTVAGILLLLFNFGLIAANQPWMKYSLAALLALVGVSVFLSYRRAPGDWWRLLLAWTLLALAATTLLMASSGQSDQPILASALLIGLTLAFMHVYLIDRALHWWAFVPSGFLFVVGLVSAVSDETMTIGTLYVLLLAGFGLVFVVLYLLSDKQRFWWALIPGGALLIVSLSTLTTSLGWGGGWQDAWPLLLIVAGLLVGWQGSRPLPAERLSVNHAPPARNASVTNKQTSKHKPTTTTRPLGEYNQPAPGTTIDVLVDKE